MFAIRRLCAVALIVFLVLPPVRADSTDDSPHFLRELHAFAIEGRLYRLEVARQFRAGALESVGAVVWRGPRVEVDLEPSMDSPGTFVHVDPTRLDQPGGPDGPTADTYWMNVLEWQAAFGPDAVEERYVVGDDRIRLRFPRGSLNDDDRSRARVPLEPIEIEINDRLRRLDRGAVPPLPGARVRPIDPVDPIVSDDIDLGPLHDPDNFSREWLRFRELIEFVHARPIVDPDGGAEFARESCAPRCLGCAAGLLGTFASSLALISSCGGSLVTGGATIPVCLVAFLAHEGAMLGAVASCGACAACADRRIDPREKPGFLCCPCLGVPDCHCPASCPTG